MWDRVILKILYPAQYAFLKKNKIHKSLLNSFEIQPRHKEMAMEKSEQGEAGTLPHTSGIPALKRRRQGD